MPRQQSLGEYSLAVAHGPKVDYVPTNELTSKVPATVAASGNWTSPVLSADGFEDFVLAVTLSQAGSLTLLRYVDDAGTIALDAGQSQALVASTAGVLIVTDGHPCASYQVKIANTGGSTGNVSGFGALLSAH